jgi:uncharacterized membrane protein YbhN (UPF0104 family)
MLVKRSVNQSDPSSIRLAGSSAIVRWLERVLGVLGAGLFAWLLYRFGIGNLEENLRLAGWGLLLVVGQEILAFLANTWGWYWSFPRAARTPPFSQLLRARIAGDAFNYVTPTASLGGEFVRFRMLGGVAGRVQVAASLSVAKVAQTLGQVAFILFGLAYVATEFAVPPAVTLGAWSMVGVFVIACGGFVWWQRRGMFGPLLRVAQWFGWLQSPEHAGRVERLDREIRALHHDGIRFWLAVSSFAVGWALGILEMYIVLWLLDLPRSFALATAIEVFSATLDGILFFVPGKLGTQEGGKVLIFSILSLDPAKGLAAGVFRRIRELVWAGIGLALWWKAQWATPRAVAPQTR